MSENAGGWDPNFPRVMRFVDLNDVYAKPWIILRQHPDYDAAKNHEDREAAADLVMDLLSSKENQAQLKALKEKYPDAIIAPVHALEANGRNKIPGMFAEYIGTRTGLEVDDSIVQTNEVHRTNSDSWHRFAFRPEFDGEVKKDRKYIIVDDVFSNGGSFSELKRYIEKNGGKVVQTAALALGGHGDEIAMRPETVKKLLDKFGEEELSSFCKEINLYAGNYHSLTEPEALALGQTPSLDEARDRIIAARQAGRSRDSEETSRGRGTDQINHPTRRRPFHR
jgi:hypothetical protein